MTETVTNSIRYLYHIRVSPGLDYDCIGDDSLHLKKGDEIIVRCDRYQDFGIICGCRDSEPVDERALQKQRTSQSKGRQVEGQRLPRVMRRATLVDKSKAHENEARANSVLRTASKMIETHKLQMKLVNAHCSFDRRLIVFQFTAEGRVDFRQLLGDLSTELHTRVELRQIGVRDEAAVQGGLGTCGRPFCCATFLRSFVSINVRMAKEQGLSLNPANISGACGRLKCCLHYEAARYRAELQSRPQPELNDLPPEDAGKIADVGRDADKPKVRLRSAEEQVAEFNTAEVDPEVSD